MCGRAYGWGVKTVVLMEESSVCLSGNSYRRQPQQACVGGGGSFALAPPLIASYPMVKALGVNCNCVAPSLNLSETTFGNALSLCALAQQTSTQLALSCSPNSALLPVFHFLWFYEAHFQGLFTRRKSRGTRIFSEGNWWFQGVLEGLSLVTLVPSGAPSLHHGGWRKFCLVWCEDKTSLGKKRLTHSNFGTSLAKDKTNQICPNGSLRETWPWSLADFWRSRCDAQACSSKCARVGG